MIARATGCVLRAMGETLLVALPGARLGDGVRIRRLRGGTLGGAVVAVDRARATVAPFGSLDGVGVGDRAEIDRGVVAAPAGFAALGRALDAAGEALDGGPPPARAAAAPAGREVPAPPNGCR